MTHAVNPDEGQVAIPWPSAPGGYRVGCLSSRAIRWVEESTDLSIDQVYEGLMHYVLTKRRTTSMTTAATVVWAGVEAERRRTKTGHGREFTVDDVDDLVDREGIDRLYEYAVTLIQLSMPFRPRSDELDAHEKAAGRPSLVDPLKEMAVQAAKQGGHDSSEPPTGPASPNPGDTHRAA